MRKFISIVEAAPAYPAQRVYDHGLLVAKRISHDLMLRQWDQEWVMALRRLIAETRQAHEKNETEEAAYHARYEEGEYQPKPFSLDVDEVTGPWWDRTVKPDVDEMLSAAKHEYERYQDWKPDVESSDQMSLHQAEISLATTISLHGSDTLEGMMAILNALEGFSHSIAYLQEIDQPRNA